MPTEFWGCSQVVKINLGTKVTVNLLVFPRASTSGDLGSREQTTIPIINIHVILMDVLAIFPSITY